jgi:OOP family OmpA-OmpF porin
MSKNVWILLLAAVFAAGCATQEAPKPAPAPAPQTPPPPPPPKPAPAPEPKKEAPKPAPKPVAEKVTFAADVTFDFDKATLKPEAGRSSMISPTR